MVLKALTPLCKPKTKKREIAYKNIGTDAARKVKQNTASVPFSLTEALVC